MPIPLRRRLLDRFGAYGSLLCAVHCALLPLLLALMPTFGLAAVFGDTFERGFVVFATLLGLFSVVWGYRRHRAVRALWLLIPGLVLLWSGVLFRPLHESLLLHAVAMTAGGSLVAFAHLANLRLNHRHVHSASCGH
ncbi:MAG: MerC domain-containing protein [Lysobacter sp.]|nr:MerC domain-containing protein [Lysobacter sp.]